MCVGFELQNDFKVWEMNDNRSFTAILASGDGPVPLATLACVKGTDTLAMLKYLALF